MTTQRTPKYRQIPASVIAAVASSAAAAAAVTAIPSLINVPDGTLYAVANTAAAEGKHIVMITQDGSTPPVKIAVAMSNEIS